MGALSLAERRRRTCSCEGLALPWPREACRISSAIRRWSYTSRTGTILANNNWKDSQESQIAATGLGPQDDSEAAIVAVLDPGSYTAILTGANGTTGIGLVEVYDLDAIVSSQLANVSTRGFVGTGDNVMIGGVIIGPMGAADATVVVRAIGPSLGALGVSDALVDPTLELHDSNGATIATNDDWQDDPAQATLLQNANFAPGDSRESAIYTTLPTGSYTAIVQGKNSTTGVAPGSLQSELETGLSISSGQACELAPVIGAWQFRPRLQM